MTLLNTSAPAPSCGKSTAREIVRDWETSHLRPLRRIEIDAVVAVMPSWLYRREWHSPEGADVRLLWEYIDRQGLGGALGALAVANLMPPGELSELAKSRYFSNMVHYERARKTCRKILAAARYFDLPIVNLKGPVLAQQAFGDPGVRAFSDLDLWARSRGDAFKLLGALEARVTEDSDLRGPVRRLRAPARILATLDGWEIEIRYPAGEATDPMVDLLNRLEPASSSPEDDCFAAPDPTWHLVLLVLHMSWYHYYSRFIWFLDLAALVSRCRLQMDFERIIRESRRLHATNLIGVASRFCRENIDPSFPNFPLDQAAWNYRFLRRVTDSGTIARGRFSLHQRTVGRMSYVLWYRIMRYFLLSDPPLKYHPGFPPERWMIATIIRSFRLTGSLMRFMARAIVILVFYPLARLTAWISIPRTEGPGGGS